MAGRAKADYQKSGLRFEEILPGNYDGAAHVADMELDGIDVSVVYPAQAIFTYVEPDRGLAIACMQSYNDWLLDDFQGADPKRIVGLPAASGRGRDRRLRRRTRPGAGPRREGGVHPGQPDAAVPRPVLRAVLGSRRRARGAADVSPHLRRQAAGGRLGQRRRQQLQRSRHGAPLPVLDAAADLPRLQRRLRAPPEPATGGRRGELRVAAVLGAEHGRAVRQPAGDGHAELLRSRRASCSAATSS